MLRSTLGQRLRRLREDRGYTQEHVSTILNVERQTYTNYENGYRTPPLDSLVQLADLFGISMDYLIRAAVRSDFYYSDQRRTGVIIQLQSFKSLTPKRGAGIHTI